MKLRQVPVKDGNIHKILILDDDKTSAEGKLVAWVESADEEEAKLEAKDVFDAILRNGSKLVWH
jgi:hypothetical protein